MALGATAAARVADACRGDVVITMLADDHAVEAVALGEGGIVASLAPDAMHVSCSTISVALSKRLAEAHAKAGQRYVAAPVFGRPEAAAVAKLFVVAAGAPDAVETVKPLLDAIGQRTFVMSEQPEVANLVKLSGNFLIGVVIESLGEAMALVGKGGVDPHAYLDLLTSTLFSAPVYRTYGGLIADRKFEPAGFAALLGLKDISAWRWRRRKICACRCRWGACCATASSPCWRRAVRRWTGPLSARWPRRMPAENQPKAETLSGDHFPSTVKAISALPGWCTPAEPEFT